MRRIVVEQIINELLSRVIIQLLYSCIRDSHIRDKVKVVLDLSNYTTKKELDHATDVDISGLAGKKISLL